MGQRGGCNKHKGKGISSYFLKVVFSKHIYKWDLYSFFFFFFSFQVVNYFTSLSIRKT